MTIENLNFFKNALVHERRKLVDEPVNNTKAKTNQRAIFNALPEIVKLQEDIDVIQRAISDEKTLVPATSSSEELRL